MLFAASVADEVQRKLWSQSHVVFVTSLGYIQSRVAPYFLHTAEYHGFEQHTVLVE